MGSQQTIQPTYSLIAKPQNYPNQPTPGKLELLWGTNQHSLYHRLSPFVDYHTSLIGGFTTQPFNYTFADENSKGLAGLRKYESRMFPIGSAPLDVIRVAKFLGSGTGIMFMGKQFLLQTGNPFNETRIYNPTSPIVAAGMGLSLGSIRPQRNFDTSGGLLGIASSLIGSAIPNAIFGEPKINKPSGTAPDALTDGPLVNTGGKGLIRGGTARSGKAHLEKAWGVSKSKGSFLKNLVTSLFANFIPVNQDDITQRSDEGAYGLMVGAGKTKFGDSFIQRWIAGNVPIMRKDNQDNKDNAGILYRMPDGSFKLFKDRSSSKLLIGTDGKIRVGYSIDNSHFRDGIRYGESFGANVDPDYMASDVMKNWEYYVDDTNKYPTKKTSQKDVDSLNTKLKSVLDNIKKASDGLYLVNVPNDATVIRSGNASVNGYDRITKTNKSGVSALQYPLGVLEDYRNVTVVDETLNHGGQKTYKLPAAGRLDALNTLEVLDKTKKIEKSKLKGWEIWNPYEDDLIAFFFYDVINEKYIPFRAIIHGLVENGAATWEEMPFIGRGDKVYSYGGFTRNLTLNFKIVISSIAELAPTWQRINYLTTLIKPANYTTDTVNNVINRFMVPPMVMLTVGDMYKDQPVLIQGVTTTIPDDAIWETLNEDNSKDGWYYLAKYITSPNVLYGQLPREVDMGLTLVLLEKERAIVGGANFAHAPRPENFLGYNTETVPNGKFPNKFDRSLVVRRDQTVTPTETPQPQSPGVTDSVRFGNPPSL